MPYKDLTPEKAVRYIREQTTLFAPDAQLRVHEINHEEGNGYVNYLYQITDEHNQSVILKHAKPYLSFFGVDAAIKVPVERNHLEADAYRVKSAITPQPFLKLLHIDQNNHIFIQEYCDKPLMRHQLYQGACFPEFAQNIGEFIAKNAFYTSELFLDQSEHKLLQARFMNPGMRRVMEEILFDFAAPFGDEQESAEFLALHHDFVPQLLQDKALMMEVMCLRDIYMKRADCLVHGDLHTSNIMIDQTGFKVFDLEYTHMGAYSGDLGYFLGNLTLAYISWHFRQDKTETERQEYRAYLLSMMNEAVTNFLRCFAQYWQQDAKPFYRENPEYFTHLFADLIPELCGFMGTQMLLCTARKTGTLDITSITDPTQRELARILSVLVGVSLIKQRRQMRSIEAIVAMVETVSLEFIAVSKI